MIRQLRNYIILLLAAIAVWFLQPSVDAFLQQRGWNLFLNRAAPFWVGFWAGAFAFLAIWGTFELYYVLRRRRARRLTTIQTALLEGLNCAYVHFVPETGEIVDSYNVTSVGDGGRGDFKLTLAKPLDPKTSVSSLCRRITDARRVVALASGRTLFK